MEIIGLSILIGLMLLIVVLFNSYAITKILHINRYIFFKNRKVTIKLFYLANILIFFILTILQRHLVIFSIKLWIALLIILIARIASSAYFFKRRLIKWHETLDSSSLLEFIAGNKFALYFVSIFIPVVVSIFTIGLIYFLLK